VSLKAIHMLFIACSILLALGFGDWCLQIYFRERQPVYLLFALLAVVALGCLIKYIFWFAKKLKSGAFK
jgi:hypothetical protein